MTGVSKLIRVSELAGMGREWRRRREEGAVTHSPASVCNQAAEAGSPIRA